MSITNLIYNEVEKALQQCKVEPKKRLEILNLLFSSNCAGDENTHPKPLKKDLDKNRCVAIKKDGDRCKNKKSKDSNYCGRHIKTPPKVDYTEQVEKNQMYSDALDIKKPSEFEKKSSSRNLRSELIKDLIKEQEKEIDNVSFSQEEDEFDEQNHSDIEKTSDEQDAREELDFQEEEVVLSECED